MKRFSGLTNEELLEKFKSEYDRLSPVRSSEDFDKRRNKDKCPSAWTILRRFGSWQAAKKAANIAIEAKPAAVSKPKSKSNSNQEIKYHRWSEYSKDDLLEIFKSEYDRLSPIRDAIDFERRRDKKACPSSATFKKYFGGWWKTKEAAGITKRRASSRYSEAEIIELFKAEYLRLYPVKDIADFINRYDNSRCPSPATICKRLGGWNAAKKIAGFTDIRIQYGRINRYEILENIRSLMSASGEFPSVNKYSKNYPFSRLAKAFGDYSGALEAAKVFAFYNEKLRASLLALGDFFIIDKNAPHSISKWNEIANKNQLFSATAICGLTHKKWSDYRIEFGRGNSKGVKENLDAGRLNLSDACSKSDCLDAIAAFFNSTANQKNYNQWAKTNKNPSFEAIEKHILNQDDLKALISKALSQSQEQSGDHQN